MQFTTIIASLTLAAGAIAGPVARPDLLKDAMARPLQARDSSSKSAYQATPVFGCLLPFQKDRIVDAFQYLLANPKADNFESTATALFSSDFTDTSDSINSIAGIPEGSVTFDGRDAFIQGSGSQPPLYTKTLDSFASCRAISWRWISTGGVGDDHIAVKGLDNFYVNYRGQITAVYAEFNSLGFSADLGYPECNSTAAA